jgi:hypothetical protein
MPDGTAMWAAKPTAASGINASFAADCSVVVFSNQCFIADTLQST